MKSWQCWFLWAKLLRVMYVKQSLLCYLMLPDVELLIVGGILLRNGTVQFSVVADNREGVRSGKVVERYQPAAATCHSLTPESRFGGAGSPPTSMWSQWLLLSITGSLASIHVSCCIHRFHHFLFSFDVSHSRQGKHSAEGRATLQFSFGFCRIF